MIILNAMRTVILLGFLIGTAVSSPVGLKNYLDDDDGYTMTRSEIAMASLNLPSNATSIRADITDGFTCENRPYGYYADVENDCQIFHVCLPVTYPDGRENMFRWSFICPEETVFSQESFTCVRSIDMAFDCDDSERFYELNRRFGINPDDSIEIPDFDGQTKRFGEKTRPAENVNQRRPAPALKTPAPTRKPTDQPILPIYNRRIPARFGETMTVADEVELPVKEEETKETLLSDLASAVLAPPNAVLKSVVHENVAEVLPTENVQVPVQQEGSLSLLKSEAMVEDEPEAEEPMNLKNELSPKPMLEEEESGQEKSVSSIDLPEDEAVKAAEIEVAAPEVKLDMDMKAEETSSEIQPSEVKAQLSLEEKEEALKTSPLENAMSDSQPEESKAVDTEPAAEPKENLSVVALKTEPFVSVFEDSEPAETNPVEAAPVEELNVNLKSESLEEPKDAILEPAKESSENFMQAEQETVMETDSNTLKSHLSELETHHEVKEEVNEVKTHKEEQPEEAVLLKSSNLHSDEPMEEGNGSTDEAPIAAQLPEEAEMPKDMAPNVAAPTNEMNQDTPLLKLSDGENADDETQKEKEKSPESGETLLDSVAESSDSLKSEVFPTVAYQGAVGVAPEVEGENHFLKAGDVFSPPYPMFNKEMMIPVRIVTDGEFPEDFYRKPELFKDSVLDESKPVEEIEETRSELKNPEPTPVSMPEAANEEKKVESLPSTEEMMKELAETIMRISEETAKKAEESNSAALQTTENKAVPVAEMILNNAPVANEETPMVKDLPKDDQPEREESLPMPEEVAKADDSLPDETKESEEHLSEQAEKSFEPTSDEEAKSAESQPEETEKLKESLSEEAEKSEEPLTEELGKSVEPAEALPAETVVAAELLTEKDGKLDEHLPEEAEKSVEPLIEEVAKSDDPLPKEDSASTENEETVKALEPLPEHPVEAVDLSPEEAPKLEEPVADEAGKAAELLSEETVEAVKPEETTEQSEPLTEEAGKSVVPAENLEEAEVAPNAATLTLSPEETEDQKLKTTEVLDETPSLELKNLPASDEEPKGAEDSNVEPEISLKTTEEKTEDETLMKKEPVQQNQEAIEMKTVEDLEYAPPVDLLRTDTFSAQDHELPFVVSFNQETAPEAAESSDAASGDSAPSLTKLLQTEDAEFLGSPAPSEPANSPLQDETPQVLAKSASSQEESQKVAEESLKSDIDVNNSVFNVVHNAESIPAEPIPEDSPKEAGRSLRYKMDPRKRRFLFRP